MPLPLHADTLPRSGQGVVLRRLQRSDLDAFQAYRGDLELARYQGWSPMSEPEALAFIDEVSAAPLWRAGEWMQIGISAMPDATLVGDIGLHLSDDALSAEIGFTLARAAQGRGLATAGVRAALAWVFESTRVERVFGITDARNEASIRLLERVGMRRIETRDTVFRGEPCVEWVYALDRADAVRPA